MTAPTGADVAAFLGAADDTALAALADEHVAVVTAMDRAYTRGGGSQPAIGMTTVVDRLRGPRLYPRRAAAD